MPRGNYPQLASMFGGYMHQDWDIEGDDWPDLVSNFLADRSSDAELAASEIDALLIEYTDDAVLEDVLLRVLGCYYVPRPDLGGPTVREWLERVARYLRTRAGNGSGR